MSFLMSDILDDIRTLAVNELGDLGDDATTQNLAIFRLTTKALRRLAKLANNVQWSDALSISANGYQTFVVSAVTITNMFQPLMVWDITGTREKQTNPRTSFDIGNGWYREADNQLIHTYGLTGNHKLQFIRYPAAITASGDTVEMPLAGQIDLIMEVVSYIKLVKNYYQESEFIRAKATGTATTKAAIAAKGSNKPTPTMDDREG